MLIVRNHMTKTGLIDIWSQIMDDLLIANFPDLKSLLDRL